MGKNNEVVNMRLAVYRDLCRYKRKRAPERLKVVHAECAAAKRTDVKTSGFCEKSDSYTLKILGAGTEKCSSKDGFVNESLVKNIR